MHADSMNTALSQLDAQLAGDQLSDTNSNQTFDFYKSPEELLYDFFWEAYFEKNHLKNLWQQPFVKNGKIERSL